MKKICLLSIVLILAASIPAPAIAGRRMVTRPKKAGEDLPIQYCMESSCEDNCVDCCKYCCCTTGQVLSNSAKFISEDCSSSKKFVCSKESYAEKAVACVFTTILTPILFAAQHQNAANHERVEKHKAKMRAATSFDAWEEYDSDSDSDEERVSYAIERNKARKKAATSSKKTSRDNLSDSGDDSESTGYSDDDMIRPVSRVVAEEPVDDYYNYGTYLKSNLTME